MGRRRFLPLIAVLGLGVFALLARLVQVQWVERDTWTAQAASLRHQGEVEPYTRGRIIDARGKVLARDVEAYQIELQYRDFRRGHALGIVAHARSALELRPVGLDEARADLASWALEIARLSPRRLTEFQRGAALEVHGVALPEQRSTDLDGRAARANDLGFYATALLDLDSRERSRLKKLQGDARAISYLDFAARERRMDPAEVAAQLKRRCSGDLEFLREFAEHWAADNQIAGVDPGAALIARLEEWRAQVEDGSASDLFEAAVGFPAGRVDAELLWETFDLDWLRASLCWDAPRLKQWTLRARERWLELQGGMVLDFAVERLRREAAGGGRVDLVLREIAPQFQEPPPRRAGVVAADSAWHGENPALVFSRLGRLFDVDLPSDVDSDPRLPFFDADFAQRVEAAPDDFLALAQADGWRADDTPIDPTLVESSLALWRRRFEPAVDRQALREGLANLLWRMEDAFQTQLRARLTGALAYARERGELASDARLPLRVSRLDRAEERVRYVLKDRGSRSFLAIARPSYVAVNLLTRQPERLRGFDVVKVHLRVHPTRDAEDRVLARLLLGRLAPPTVSRRVNQQLLEREIRVLEARGDRDEAAEQQLAELRAALDRPDEKVGAFGLERWFEPELAGRNGFRETRGLAERERDGGGGAVVDKVDGLDLVTTLDSVLQAEAEACLEHPVGDNGVAGAGDSAWLAQPTGAIVLLDPAGDVIAAASVPLEPRETGPGRIPTSDDVRERTLTKPDFQPPGSVFKIFVAAYALDVLGLDPRATRECSAAMNPGGRGPGYGGVHCHETNSGHGVVDLERALAVSCNSYFAWLGEQYDAASLDAMAREFGFGEGTGVRYQNGLGRAGLQEDVVPDLFRNPRHALIGRNLREAGNGLTVVEATPMQVARATAALATGHLPTLRLVSRIGPSDLPREGRALAISTQALERVRKGMRAVCESSEGSAHLALSQAQLGFSMAAKTGSADLTSTAVDGTRVLKHTWVAGWFPAERPVGVLVVFVHRTTRTSSHGAIWLARQFLTRPAVAEWVRERSLER